MAQVSILKSNVITNRDAFKPNDLRTAGRNFMKRARIKTLAADSAGSMYGLFSLPSNAVIVAAIASNEAMGTSCTFDIGLFETEVKGGFSATTGWLTLAGGVSGADQFFADAYDVAAAHSKIDLTLNNTNFYTLANCDQMIWQVLGLASDPSQTAQGATEYDVVVTVEVATVNAANFLFEVSYKMQ